jgi:hypothetical protein
VNVSITGVSTSASATNGLYCDVCQSLILGNDVIGGTLTNGMEAFHSLVYFAANVTLSGYSSTAGLGAYIGNASMGVLSGGTLTITGPGGSGTTSLGLVMEFQSGFQIIPTTGNPAVTITGNQVGIQLSLMSSFADFVSTGAVTITNSAIPSNSHGIEAGAGSNYAQSAGTLAITDFTYCAYVYQLGGISQGPGGRTLTSCTASNSPNQNGLVIFF